MAGLQRPNIQIPIIEAVLFTDGSNIQRGETWPNRKVVSFALGAAPSAMTPGVEPWLHVYGEIENHSDLVLMASYPSSAVARLRFNHDDIENSL